MDSRVKHGNDTFFSDLYGWKVFFIWLCTEIVLLDKPLLKYRSAKDDLNVREEKASGNRAVLKVGKWVLRSRNHAVRFHLPSAWRIDVRFLVVHS